MSSTPGLLLVIMENQQAINVLGNQNAPHLTALAQRFPVATRYFARTHPSLPNYLELWSGSTFGVADDGPPASHPLTGPTLGSQLSGAGIEWAAYFDGLVAGQDPTVDGGGTDSAGTPLYVVKHDPLLYFAGYDAARIKPFASLLGDLDGPTPPGFALVVPSMAHNMHDPVGSTAKDATAVQAGDEWFQDLFDQVQASAWWAAGGMVVLVWDEAYDGSGNTVPGGIGTPPTDGGPVVCMLLGRVLEQVRPGTFGLGGDSNWDTPLSHAGLLRSIETYFGLPPLGDAANPTYGDISSVLLAAARSAP